MRVIVTIEQDDEESGTVNYSFDPPMTPEEAQGGSWRTEIVDRVCDALSDEEEGE